jgi:hypothetical protein
MFRSLVLRVQTCWLSHSTLKIAKPRLQVQGIHVASVRWRPSDDPVMTQWRPVGTRLSNEGTLPHKTRCSGLRQRNGLRWAGPRTQSVRGPAQREEGFFQKA